MAHRLHSALILEVGVILTLGCTSPKERQEVSAGVTRQETVEAVAHGDRGPAITFRSTAHASGFHPPARLQAIANWTRFAGYDLLDEGVFDDSGTCTLRWPHDWQSSREFAVTVMAHCRIARVENACAFQLPDAQPWRFSVERIAEPVILSIESAPEFCTVRCVDAEAGLPIAADVTLRYFGRSAADPLQVLGEEMKEPFVSGWWIIRRWNPVESIAEGVLAGDATVLVEVSGYQPRSLDLCGIRDWSEIPLHRK